MKKIKNSEKAIRYSLVSLLFFLAINAFFGGYYGMAGAKNVPREWLTGSPFSSYFVPGLVLFIVVGGSAFIAAVALLQRRPGAHIATLISAIAVILWLGIQLVIIGYVSWMQPATAAGALVILYLAWKLPLVDS